MYLLTVNHIGVLTTWLLLKSLRLSSAARKQTSIGEMVNLMSVDAHKFIEVVTYINMMWSCPVQITISMVLLWQTLGPSILAGIAVMITVIVTNMFVSSKQKILQVTLTLVVQVFKI